MRNLLILFVLAMGGFIYLRSQEAESVNVIPTLVPTPTLSSPVPTQNTTQILLSVPFVAQAPFGEWSDPRQEDGCEEASSLMAVRWANKQGLTPQEAKDQILAMSAYQEETYGEYRDTSAQDTLDRIIKGYLNYQNAEAKSIGSAEDIISELRNGNLVIVPVNGQTIGNPNYKAPGPERHMIVVIGYNLLKNTFITNDPGTRNGKGYQYSTSRFFDSIRDFPSGYHVPIEKVEKKMIVVKPEQ